MVLTVGFGDVGQLGLGPDVEEMTRLALVTHPEDIVAIAAGGVHTVCLDKKGKVSVIKCVFTVMVMRICHVLPTHPSLESVLILCLLNRKGIRERGKPKLFPGWGFEPVTCYTTSPLL